MSDIIKTTLCCLCLTLLVLSGRAPASDDVKIVVDAYNPPNMHLCDGRAAGLYPHLLEAVFKRMGQTVTIDAVPWKRAMSMGARGQAGVAGIYKTEERLQVYDYSEVLYNELLLVFVKKGHQFEFDSVQDLEGKTIGALLGWSYGEEFDKARSEGLFQVESVNRDALNFMKLNEGRVDCVVASKESGLYEIARNGLDNIIALPHAVLINPTYVAFSKDAYMGDLLSEFNHTLQAMKSDGEYSRLINEFIKRIDKHMNRDAAQ